MCALKCSLVADPAKMETLPRCSEPTEVLEKGTGIPPAMPGKQLNNNAAALNNFGATEIILRIFYMVSHKLSTL